MKTEKWMRMWCGDGKSKDEIEINAETIKC